MDDAHAVVVSNIVKWCGMQRWMCGQENNFIRCTVPEPFVAGELTSYPQEGLLEVIVALRRNVKILKVFLAMEGDLLCFDLAVLDLDFVAREHNRNLVTHAVEVTVPVRHVLVPDFVAQ